jgi:hypothetical protein
MTVEISEDADRALSRLAQLKRRDARDQAAVLIERALEREGLLEVTPASARAAAAEVRSVPIAGATLRAQRLPLGGLN